MHSLPMLLCHRLRADVMAPGERGGWAAHHQPAMVRQWTWAITSAKSAITNCRASDHFPALVSYRADGVPAMAGYWSRLACRRDGGHQFSFDQEVWPDQAGITPSMRAGLGVMNLLRTSTWAWTSPALVSHCRTLTMPDRPAPGLAQGRLNVLPCLVAWPVMSSGSEPSGASPVVPETRIWSWPAGTGPHRRIVRFAGAIPAR